MSVSRPARWRRARRAAVLSSLAVGAVASGAADAGAQRPTGRQFEGRVDAIMARVPSVQGGVALNVPAGLYVRLGAAVAGGVAHHHGASRGAARGDVFARFLLDPFREAPHGLYGVGGISAMYDGFEKWRPRVLAGVGIEGAVRHGRSWGGELALGGGVRITLFMRSARASGR